MTTYTATYSPDDNKLRLYASTRLDKETYQRVRDAGFIWAPKQEVFVAPKWTPSRADFLIEMCGEIGDEDTSLVDRAEERADRFDDYSDSRAQDAQAARSSVDAVAKRFEFGQPILVGHHSERRARKDAERIENGMRKAVKMWDTSQYWKQRAAGALRHAKYKERPDVRARRIKTIEADKRKEERVIAEAEKFLKAWQSEGLTMEQAKHIAGFSYYSRRFTLAEFQRDPPASQYEGDMGLYSALEGGVITVEQARDICLRTYPATIAWARRWIEHYDNRLAYERGMLDEQGGLASDRFDIQVGGTVLAGREWLVVIRVNKSGGKVSSVTTNRKYVRVVSIEEISDYRAPDAEQVAKVKAATKLAPLANYPGEGFAHITQEKWDSISKDYRGTETVAATDTVGRHRVRTALACFATPEEKEMNKRHRYLHVFITDLKRVDPPAAATAPAKAEALPTPEPADIEARPVYQAPEPTEFDKMREQLKEGVKVVSAPQLFPTPPALAARMVELAEIDTGHAVLEPSAGTGNILRAIADTIDLSSINVAAVEINHNLSAILSALFKDVQTKCENFLNCNGDLGKFDRILMNPPFANGQDIQHITHAVSMLKPGGRLVAICANGPRQNEKLRPLVEKHSGEWEELPSGTFIESGTGVNTVLLSLTA